VLIRVLKTSICGTDVHIYNWDAWAQKTIPVPMTIDHEFVGVVDDVGDHVKGFAKGDLVVGEGHITCGHCRNCLAGRRHLCPNTQGVGVNRNGAWAEFVVIPQSNCWHADSSIPLDVLSCFDPLGNAVHTALSFDLVGEDVLITGAGPIGCMAIPICKHAGARHVVITDVNSYRLELAWKMGGDLALNVRDEKTRYERRLRRRARDVREPESIRRHFAEHVSREKNRVARHHAWYRRDRLEHGCFRSTDDQRNLRTRNVRNLVQNDRPYQKWRRYLTRHHSPVSLHEVQGSD